MSARSAARRHRDELGGVVAGYWDRPTPLVIGAFVALWLLFSGLTLVNPGETTLLAVAPTVTFAILFSVALLYVGNERLLVCERGLVIGAFAPGVRPYVVRYDQIVPGSVVPGTGARRYARETGSGGLAQSTVRRASTSSAPPRRWRVVIVPGSRRCRTHRRALSTVAGSGSPVPGRRRPSRSRPGSRRLLRRRERPSWPIPPRPRRCAS